MFDIKIGSGIDNACKKLEDLGYQKIPLNSGGTVCYFKGRVQIGLNYEFFEMNGKVTEVEVALKSSDWFHKGYYK